MKRSLLVRGARQLVTLQGGSAPRRGPEMRDLSVIPDGSVLISDGHIVRVGPTRQVENVAEARDAEEINAAGRLVMPAFVDSHTQLIAPSGGIARTGCEAGTGCALPGSPQFLRALEWVRNAAPSKLESDARRYLEAAVRHGTLTLETGSGFGLNAAAELKILRVLGNLGNSVLSLVPTFSGAFAPAPEFADPSDYMSWLCSEMLSRLRDRKFVRYVDAHCDSGAFTSSQLRPYLHAAVRSGYPLKLYGDQRVASGCAALALDFGAVSVAGLNEIGPEDIDSLARASIVSVLLPGNVQALGLSRPAPGRQLLDAGAIVALASGFHPCATSTFNMQTVVSLACETMSFSAEEAIVASTVNAAHAVGRSGACGTLECGREADLLILNASDYREIPLHYGCNLVSLVLRAGEVVWREGPLTCGNS